MKYPRYILTAALLLLFINAAIPIARANNVLVVKKESGEITTAAPLDSKTVITFDDDEMNIRYGNESRTILKSDFSRFEFPITHTSNFEIRILDRRDNPVPLSDIQVKLRKGKIVLSDAITDKEGIALFENIPTGLFSLMVGGSGSGLLPVLYFDPVHFHNDCVTVYMNDVLSTPGITAEPDNAVYYDMNGRLVVGNPTPGIYIRKTSSGAEKVIVQ